MTRTKASLSRLPIVLGAAFLFATGAARAEDGVLRVGIITDMSGQYADGNGTGSVVAAQMAAEEIGGTVAGRKIEIISADHQNKPDVAAGIVRNWIDNKGVDVVAEGVNSAVALAIQTVTRERKKLFLISGSGSSDLTGKQCSPTSVHWTYDTYASSNATAKAVVARGGTPWFFLTADYAFGQALERDASKAVTASGGKVLGAVRHPFDTADFSSFLLQAQSSGAKILALANAGSDFRNAVAQADEFNIRESMQLVALQVTLTDVPALGLQHAHDLLFTDSFYWDRTPETRAFAEEFFKRHGAMPTAYQAGVNSALRHYFKAVAATNSVDSETVIAQMRKTPVNDFFAQGGVVREDGRMVHDMYLMRIKKPEESKGNGTSTNISRPCPATRPSGRSMKAAALTSRNRSKRRQARGATPTPASTKASSVAGCSASCAGVDWLTSATPRSISRIISRRSGPTANVPPTRPEAFAASSSCLTNRQACALHKVVAFHARRIWNCDGI